MVCFHATTYDHAMNPDRLMALARQRRIHDLAIACGLFALSLLAVNQIGGQDDSLRMRDTVGYVLIGAMTLPLMWRQLAPRTVMAVIALAWAIDRGINYEPTLAAAGIIVAVHALGAHLPPRRSWIAASIVFIAAVGWTAVGVFWVGVVGWIELVSVGLYVAVPYAIGRADAISRATITQLELENQATAAAQKDAADAAVRSERARIARELHDVVAHEITVITLQAEGAKRATSDPTVAETLDNISESGRKGLEEMHRMIAVLRDSTDDSGQTTPTLGAPVVGTGMTDLAPAPSLAGLEMLADQVREAGVPVSLTIEGNAHVPAGVELSAYRIVQESLTNILKHAGEGARADVTIVRQADTVRITIEDDGRGSVTEVALQSGGHGVVGMKERVQALGGTLDVGPRPGGGFRVRATLPSHDDTTSPAMPRTR